MLNALRDQGFDVLTRNHSDAILAHDFPDELGALVTELTSFRITAEELIGGESGRVTSVVRYDPKSSFPEHGHPLGEEILVLEDQELRVQDRCVIATEPRLEL